MIPFIGLASGVGAGNSGCHAGPFVIQKNFPIDVEWKTIITPEPTDESTPTDKLELIAHLNRQLAEETYTAALNHPFTVVIGGDHSCAVGTWSGIAEAKRTQGEEIGLIWIDAHKDSHTPETSESGNIHGMPLASLMGYGSSSLTHILSPMPKIKPENLFLVGIRSYEDAEKELLERLNVRIYYIEEVKERGLHAVLSEILEHYSSRKISYGISLDIDAFDPSIMSATGSPVENGFDPQEFIDCCSIFDAFPPIAFEYVEFNPAHDTQGQSLYWTMQILQRVSENRILASI
jgi:arginase